MNKCWLIMTGGHNNDWNVICILVCDGGNYQILPVVGGIDRSSRNMCCNHDHGVFRVGCHDSCCWPRTLEDECDFRLCQPRNMFAFVAIAHAMGILMLSPLQVRVYWIWILSEWLWYRHFLRDHPWIWLFQKMNSREEPIQFKTVSYTDTYVCLL